MGAVATTFLVLAAAAIGFFARFSYESSADGRGNETDRGAMSSSGSHDAKEPFWGCGLVGKAMDPAKAVWKGLIADLKTTSDFDAVATWNWDVKPRDDDRYNGDFLFFPNAQCAATSADAERSFPRRTMRLSGGTKMASLALGGNEPDQVGYCQDYTKPGQPITACDGFKMRDGKCTGDAECRCDWKGGKCEFGVTGCGMWPAAAEGCDGSFPFQCAGKNAKLCAPGEKGPDCCPPACKRGMAEAFKEFYMTMADKGYSHASTPVVASDPSFNVDLLKAAECDAPEVVAARGAERLKLGCPTHTAFHFYSEGCPDPNDGGASIEDFKRKVAASKQINKDFGMSGTIVNELGSLQGPGQTHCPVENMSGMMTQLFDHLQTDEGKGVVSQMVWFNQDGVGGTFDLRLVKDDAMTPLGQNYVRACSKWAQHART